MLFNFIKTYFYYYNTDNFSFIFYTCREEESGVFVVLPIP